MRVRRRARRPLGPASGQRPRRDPRREREPGGQALEDDTPVLGPSGRPRHDPRSIYRRAGVAASGRRRIDRSGRAACGVTERVAPAATAGPRPVRLEDPAFWILVVPDYDQGRLSGHDRDVFGAARRLADSSGGAVAAVVFGEGEDPGAAGADRLFRLTDTVFAGYAPEARLSAVQAIEAQLRPRHVLCPDTAIAAGDIGRRLAAALGVDPATRVHRLRADEAVSRGDGQRSDYARVPPRVLLMAAECEAPLDGTTCHEARPMQAPAFTASAPRIEDSGLLPVDPGTVPLAEAEFVISAGNGVTDWPAFHALARALGAAEGGSRVVCDAGSLPRERQVGASGTLIEARCYLAFGISGAPQHLQGIARCEKVVAVNTDLHAEMIKRGDLSAIKDAQAVMPALTRLLEGEAPDA